MKVRLVTAPAVEPISYLDVEAQIRATLDTTEYAFVNGLISAARHQAETITRRALVTQTIELSLNSFPEVIELPFPPVQSVTSIEYKDADGVLTTLAADQYTLDNSEPARIIPAYGVVWPTALNYLDSVKVTFVCGYGLAADVPEPIRQWLLVTVADMYENRESINIGNITSTLGYLDALLTPYRVLTF